MDFIVREATEIELYHYSINRGCDPGLLGYAVPTLSLILVLFTENPPSLRL
jgi:hypothetical protein